MEEQELAPARKRLFNNDSHRTSPSSIKPNPDEDVIELCSEVGGDSDNDGYKSPVLISDSDNDEGPEPEMKVCSRMFLLTLLRIQQRQFFRTLLVMLIVKVSRTDRSQTLS